jgi:hypothetical protein
MTPVRTTLSLLVFVIPVLTAVHAQGTLDKQPRCIDILESDLKATARLET